jgi:hypothetical protein
LAVIEITKLSEMIVSKRLRVRGMYNYFAVLLAIAVSVKIYPTSS